MDKFLKKKRIFLSIFLVVSVCFASIGAQVSDNDGSAFITKGEYDSLRSSFQAQINEYQSNIDSKIDGAIAAYIAGRKISKETQVNFKLTQKRWYSINNEIFQEKHIGETYAISHVVYMTASRTSANVGISGYIRVLTDPGAAKGVLFNTWDTDIDNGKIGIIKGYGERRDRWVGSSIVKKGNTAYTADFVKDSLNNFQLNWWKTDVSRTTQLPTERTYYGDCYETEDCGDWAPTFFGAKSGSDVVLGDNSKGEQKSYGIEIKYLNDKLYLVNDEEVTTCIDDKRGNGFALIPEAPSKLGSTIYKTLSAITGLSNTLYNKTQTSNPAYVLLQAGWTGTANFEAYTTSLGVATTDVGYNTGSGNSHKGYDRNLYVSHVDKPTKLLTDKLINDEKFVNWLKKNAPADAYGTYKINDVTNTYYNIRYGIPLAHENDKNAKYKLTLVNNSGEDELGFKVYNKLTTTNFDSLVGLETNKSDKNRNNVVKVATSSTIEVKFEVKNDNSPIFLKCSDGADINLVSLFKEVEE